jgi:tetratricopeptide (TPR) repeat protein
LSESSQNKLREVLAETARVHAAPARRRKLAGVRRSPGGYLAFAAILTFASLLALRVQHELVALIMILGTWTVVPLLILSDRLNFDGKVLSRNGLAAFGGRLLYGHSTSIAVDDIERVEVTTLRTLRRGGNVRYRYRVEVAAGEISMVFASGGREFRRMVRTLLPQISDHKLDARARELRDHLVDNKLWQSQARLLGIASVSVLEATRPTRLRKTDRREALVELDATEEAERGHLLRQSANGLRIAGRLPQAAEAFRRALLITPRDPWLIYEYARLLKSQASATGDPRLLGRACAALRLAVSRGPNDARLLERIGESFLEYVDPVRAAKAFRHALELDDLSYRAHLGLAEVALGDGKLAHVIHHYNDAVRVAPDKAGVRLARREADYYAQLNNDEEYLAAELRRMNWLEGAGRIQRLTARVSFAALLIALIGSSIDQVVAGLGWALASSSIIAWSGALVVKRFLSPRGRIQASDA